MMCYRLRDPQQQDITGADQERGISSLVPLDHQQQILHSRCQAMCCPKHLSNVLGDRPDHAGFHRLLWQHSGMKTNNTESLFLESQQYRWCVKLICILYSSITAAATLIPLQKDSLQFMHFCINNLLSIDIYIYATSLLDVCFFSSNVWYCRLGPAFICVFMFAEGWSGKVAPMDISGRRSGPRGAHPGVRQSLWNWSVLAQHRKHWTYWTFSGDYMSSIIWFVF